MTRSFMSRQVLHRQESVRSSPRAGSAVLVSKEELVGRYSTLHWPNHGSSSTCLHAMTMGSWKSQEGGGIQPRSDRLREATTNQLIGACIAPLVLEAGRCCADPVSSSAFHLLPFGRFAFLFSNAKAGASTATQHTLVHARHFPMLLGNNANTAAVT